MDYAIALPILLGWFILIPQTYLKQRTVPAAVTPAMVGDLNPPPTLMPTARLLTNGALGGGLKHAKDETDN